MKTCRDCGQEFESKHFNQRLCSDECKLAAKRANGARYKKTDKGKITEARWIASECRTDNEKRYRAKPRAMKLACERSKRHKIKCPLTEAQKEHHRQYDRVYAKSKTGRSKNREATARYRKTKNGRKLARESKLRRRALGKINYDDFISKAEELNWRCIGCGLTLNFDTVTVDHIRPVSKGGANDIDNLQPMCQSCNSSKGAKWKPSVNVDAQ